MFCLNDLCCSTLWFWEITLLVLFKPALLPPDRKFDLTLFKPRYAISVNIDIFMIYGAVIKYLLEWVSSSGGGMKIFWVTNGGVQKRLRSHRRRWYEIFLTVDLAIQNYFDFISYIICTWLFAKKLLPKDFSFLSEFFAFLTLYWGIWKRATLTKMLVFGFLLLVELLLLVKLLLVTLLMFYSESYCQLGWFLLTLAVLS